MKDMRHEKGRTRTQSRTMERQEGKETRTQVRKKTRTQGGNNERGEDTRT